MISIDLSGRVALVTGGSKGIGAGIVEVLARAGAQVIINCEGQVNFAEEVKTRVINDGGKADIYVADIMNRGHVGNMFDWIQNKYGRLDILVNNAGMSTVGNIEELSYEQIDKVLDLNIKGVINCCKEAMPYLSKTENASIVNIASTSMYTGGGGGLHYAGSKSALLGITRNLSKSYGPKGVRTNALAITLIDTELFRNRYQDQDERNEVINQVPIQRLGTPEDVGFMSAYLSSDLGSFINGEIITMDGGRTFA